CERTEEVRRGALSDTLDPDRLARRCGGIEPLAKGGDPVALRKHLHLLGAEAPATIDGDGPPPGRSGEAPEDGRVKEHVSSELEEGPSAHGIGAAKQRLGVLGSVVGLVRAVRDAKADVRERALDRVLAIARRDDELADAGGGEQANRPGEDRLAS